MQSLAGPVWNSDHSAIQLSTFTKHGHIGTVACSMACLESRGKALIPYTPKLVLTAVKKSFGLQLSRCPFDNVKLAAQHAFGGMHRILFHRTRQANFEPQEQCFTLHLRATLQRDGLEFAEADHTLQHNAYFHRELLVLLAQAGFSEVSASGDYSESALSADHAMAVYIGRKPRTT